MSGSSFLLSVCPKHIGNVAKTLREVGTYELVQGTVTGDGAHAVGLLGCVFLPVLLVKYHDRVGLSSAKTVWESARCFERDAFSGAWCASSSVKQVCSTWVASTRDVYIKYFIG